jgi:hypothetical protein
MHVVRQNPRMVRHGSGCVLGLFARSLPRVRELDLDPVSVSRSRDSNSLRALRVVGAGALAMVNAVETVFARLTE